MLLLFEVVIHYKLLRIKLHQEDGLSIVANESKVARMYSLFWELEEMPLTPVFDAVCVDCIDI